jgi:hypothetical protein
MFNSLQNEIETKKKHIDELDILIYNGIMNNFQVNNKKVLQDTEETESALLNKMYNYCYII